VINVVNEVINAMNNDVIGPTIITCFIVMLFLVVWYFTNGFSKNS
jgi:hypothetical protein